jgi:hypothetical protein
MIAVNQDRLGIQGKRIVGNNLHLNNTILNGTNVWAKVLHDGAVAVVFVNTFPSPVAITCDEKCASLAGLPKVFSVLDLWTNKVYVTNVHRFTASVDGNGASRAFRCFTDK